MTISPTSTPRTVRSHPGPDTDVVVVGAGAAGLSAALAVAAGGGRAVVLSKGSVLDSGSSFHAQGGVAAAVGVDDSPALHAADTIAAGRSLCRESAVFVLVGEAPERVAELRELGVPFAPEPGLEGGHRRRRVLNVDGAETGAAITRVLAAHAGKDDAITLEEGTRAVGLLVTDGVCSGVLTDRGPVAARAVVLATGGAAGLWARTTNPVGNVGDGIALAFAAGAAVADLEFTQFHPTALEGSGFLLSEALRGEGALLLGGDGRRFTDELAPRDIVARAVGAQGTALLDLRPVDRSRFPALVARLEAAGFDPSREPVPVAPAAHYTMGGIVTDVAGRTDLPGLLAAGECACTGVHGANRLASNSLLECLVFGRRAGLASLSVPLPVGRAEVVSLPPAALAASPEVREAMWEHAGLVRDEAGLAALRGSSNLVVRLVAEAALARRESRGGHFRVDFPYEDDALAGLHTVLRPGRAPELERWS
jgi:L-aspartate oxidase